LADTKITDLPSETAAAGDELVINDVTDTSDKKITVQGILDLVPAGGGLTFAKIVKATDETIDTDTTLSDDAELLFTPTINKVYHFELRLYIQSATAADFKVGWSVPSGATVLGLEADIWRNDILQNADDQTVAFAVATDGNLEMMLLCGKILMSSTSGSAAVQWAQNVSNGGNTTVLAGSTLLVYEEGST